MFSSGDCLYSILGVNQDANDSELKSAYFKLAKQYHPDVNSSNEATQMFIDINNAYEVLADKDKRAQYDERRKRKQYRHEKRPHDKSMEDIIKFWNKMNTEEFKNAERPFDIHATKVYGGNHSGANNYKTTILYISSEIYFQMNVANRHKENMKKHIFGAHTNCKYCIEENRQELILKRKDLSLNDAISLNGGNHNNMKFLFHRLLEKQRNGENTVGPTKPPKDH